MTESDSQQRIERAPMQILKQVQLQHPSYFAGKLAALVTYKL